MQRLCAQAGCAVLVPSGHSRCPAHTVAPYANATRTHQGKYQTSRWQQARAGFLAHHPWCVVCEAEGRTTVATTVDHIDPMGAFWDRDNWAALCAPCHNSKTAREANARRVGVK